MIEFRVLNNSMTSVGNSVVKFAVNGGTDGSSCLTVTTDTAKQTYDNGQIWTERILLKVNEMFVKDKTSTVDGVE